MRAGRIPRAVRITRAECTLERYDPRPGINRAYRLFPWRIILHPAPGSTGNTFHPSVFQLRVPPRCGFPTPFTRVNTVGHPRVRMSSIGRVSVVSWFCALHARKSGSRLAFQITNRYPGIRGSSFVRRTSLFESHIAYAAVLSFNEFNARHDTRGRSRYRKMRGVIAIRDDKCGSDVSRVPITADLSKTILPGTSGLA